MAQRIITIRATRRHLVTLAFSLAGLLFQSPATAAAQPSSAEMEAGRAAAQQAMDPLMWMVGEWKGPATVTFAPGRSMKLTQHETVRPGAFKTALFMQGRGTVLQDGMDEVVFEAAGLLTYDAASKRFLFTSSGGSGNAGHHDVNIDGAAMTWSYSDGAQLRVRYIIRLTADDKWLETGATSHDGGKTWMDTFEMTLTRAK